MELYNEENNEFYVYCDVCNKFCITRWYDNHIKSISQTNNPIKFKKIQNKSFFLDFRINIKVITHNSKKIKIIIEP